MKHLRGSWLHRRLGDRLLDPHLWQLDRQGLARGLAIGSFFSMMPIPLQSLPAALLAIASRSNVPAALVGCWITNPLTAPFFIFFCLYVGGFLLGRGSTIEAMRDHSAWEIFKQMPLPLLVGVAVICPILAVSGYFLGGWAYDLLSIMVRRSGRQRASARRARKDDAKR